MSISNSTIPTDFLLKRGTYNVNVNGFDLKVIVAVHAQTIIEGISELRTKLRGFPSKIVGISILSINSFHLLQLCVDNHCLVVVLSRVRRPLPSDLTDFLDEPFICFVGLKIDLSQINLGRFSSVYDHEFLRGKDVRELTARVLKKPDLLQKRLFKEVAAEVGICFDDCRYYEILKSLPYANCAFSNHQVKCLARYTHSTYLIGKKLLNMLN